MREFHLTRKIRDKFNITKQLSPLERDGGNKDYQVRQFTNIVNAQLDQNNQPDQRFRAGEVNAIGLMDEIYHEVVNYYRTHFNKGLYSDLETAVDKAFTRASVDKFLNDFIHLFPPHSVYINKQTAKEYLNGTTGEQSNRWLLLEKLVFVWLANQNPANGHYKILFDDNELKSTNIYSDLIEEIQEYIAGAAPFVPQNTDLISMLRSPALHEPTSLFRQLDYIREHWGQYLGNLLARLLSGMDLIREEEKNRFGGPGPTVIPTYDGAFSALDEERFSQDRDWMPSLVLIAKNAYVWLDQLSKKYQIRIDKLSDIPNEELLRLAGWGINGLWLIGLWERSRASARIKQLCGNPEAISSAYALYDYQIAADLGGEAAYQNLSDRARKCGIRLASDMVPNHMAIDSRWVMERPDWFISLEHPPFPAYQYTGPNLSDHPDIELYIENRYFDQTDAAVVFKLVDRRNNREQYIYHGNDGTSFPWNDTAQLDYLNAELREAVIQTIIHVARKFPIIRFDAAMTLTKMHYQRLWFPPPGTGGDIPSRTSYTIDKEAFEQAMPREFWREVVDRIAEEAPDTLLLAEAFWLMESYFVRSLGMHRVYNSAFMNLLRNEENAKFRTLIKNTLEFDPEILKRFVNFLSNPDEKTAVEQFGKGDKYFGVCTLMVTLPGLPMFGHGQIEGFTEKYGMEYKKAYWDEIEDRYLIEEHQKRIFPLLHKRDLFAHSEQFLLYDFYQDQGKVEEEVIAYSNHRDGESALVVYNNKFAQTKGWINISAAYLQKSDRGKSLVQKSLAEGLHLADRQDTFIIFKDMTTELEYIRPAAEMINQGLFLALNAYQTHVFYDFQQMNDVDGSLAELEHSLKGRGVSSIADARHDIYLRPIHNALREILNESYLNDLVTTLAEGPAAAKINRIKSEYKEKLSNLFEVISSMYHTRGSIDNLIARTTREFSIFCRLAVQDQNISLVIPGSKKWKGVLQKIQSLVNTNDKQDLVLVMTWITLHNIGQLVSQTRFEQTSAAWFQEWKVKELLRENFRAWFDNGEDDPGQFGRLLHTLIAYPSFFDDLQIIPIAQIFRARFQDAGLRKLIGINRAGNIEWFNREKFTLYMDWLFVLQALEILSAAGVSRAERMERCIVLFEATQFVLQTVEDSDYQTEKLLHLLETGEIAA